ncbi:MAG: MotA/TolQ/ExbB proton channel family protein, partial [Nitrospinaceae bacterium]
SVAADWVKAAGFKHVAIIGENSDWGLGVIDVFKRNLDGTGAKVTSFTAERTVTDFTPQLLQLKRADPRPDLLIAGFTGAGLLQMLSSLDDVSSVGPKMAVALITTFYGAVLANLFFIPMTVKLKRRSAAETLEMNLVLEGIIFIRKGVNPRFMKETLENYLENALGKKVKKEGAQPAAPAKAKK